VRLLHPGLALGRCFQARSSLFKNRSCVGHDLKQERGHGGTAFAVMIEPRKQERRRFRMGGLGPAALLRPTSGNIGK